ncbi:MAG: metal ABC transporter ATP-binding protein [Verrucomicrobia bacterium]|nr:metal ABC transporter ATP-binding protein [Verrucomicrobiota bacterium]
MSTHSLQVEDLTVSYRRVPALHHVGFSLSCGSSVGVLGPNGAGKSTLLKALAGLLRLETGEIIFHGRQMRGANQEFAYLPQRETVDWDFPTTVRGVVEMGRYLRLRWWRRFSAEDRVAVDAALSAMQMTELQDRQISALSGGQQQRVFLARALAQEAHVLLLDEPFNGLDQPSQEGLKLVFRQLREQGKLLLISHHDLASVPELFDQVLLLNGELLAGGPVKEVFTKENLARAYGTRVFSGVSHGLAV